MPKRTDDLVHEMPLTKTVRLKFRRVGVEYKNENKKSGFKYQLMNWPSSNGPAPIIDIEIDDWEDDKDRPKRHKLKDVVEKKIDTDMMAAIVAQLGTEE